MKTTFVSACMIGAAIAGPQTGRKLQNNPKFVNYMAHNNKHYTSTHELNLRAGLFATAENEVRNLNARSQRSGKHNAARFETNFLADLTEDEKKMKLGLVSKDHTKRTQLYHNKRNGLGVATATTVDHAADGFMHAVKDQGNCGSCYAFAANTALEGYVAKKKNDWPVRLSEQHIVDCTLIDNASNNADFGTAWQGKNYGCQGGWMENVWYFQNKNGVMLDSDYAYTSGNSARETPCKHSASKTIGKVTQWEQIKVSDGIQGVKDKLATHPMTIAVDAGRAAFQYYSSGVVSLDDNCGKQLNHAIVLVGYTDDGEVDPSPGPGPNPDPEPPVDEVCTVTKWWHSCEGGDNRRQLQDSNGYNNYWKVQNSWGTGWGDNGFILFDIVEGDGVCGMNMEIQWAEM